jgi:hypothetical protein
VEACAAPSLAAQKQPIERAPIKLDPGWAAMVALINIGRALHIA